MKTGVHLVLTSHVKLTILLLTLVHSTALHAQSWESVGSFGSRGDAAGEFREPSGLAVDSFGRVFIADTQNHRTQFCSPDGSCFRSDPGPGTSPGLFRNPLGVWIDSRLGVTERGIIADTGNDRIQICGLTGACQLMGRNGQFKDPRGVVVDSAGRFIVADSGNNRIQVCEESGSCRQFGREGTALGKFQLPHGVAVLNGEIVIGDRLNHRVQICPYDDLCRAFGSFGTAVGQFFNPSGVAVTADKEIVIADSGNHRIQVCTVKGDCEVFGTFGSGPGQLSSPAGVAVDNKGQIWVADTGNDRIQVFARSMGPTPINVGMNDNWYRPQMAGQGLFVDVFTELNQVFVMWFTFDSERPADSVKAKLGGPGQRWYSAQGPIGTDNVARLKVILSQGGVFNKTEPKVSTSQVGSATLQFNGCKEAVFSYMLNTPAVEGVQNLQRIALDNVALCEYFASRNNAAEIERLEASQTRVEPGEWVEISWQAGGADYCAPSRGPSGWTDTLTGPEGGSAWFMLEEPGVHDFSLECATGGAVSLRKVLVEVAAREAENNFAINDGLSGNWFDPATSGQGFYVTVWPELKQIFLGWFTYDTERPPAGTPATVGEPGHRWLTAQGPYSGNAADLALNLTTGGVFEAEQPKVTNTPYGTVRLEFKSCTEATVKFDLPTVGQKGEIALQRLTQDNVPLCEALKGGTQSTVE